MDAYASTSVPNDAVLPYLTYDASVGAWDSGEMPIAANIWMRTFSEAVPNAKAQEVSEAIGDGGVILLCDGGYVWLKRGSPFCQSMRDDTDESVKRRYINITAEYLTQN